MPICGKFGPQTPSSNCQKGQKGQNAAVYTCHKKQPASPRLLTASSSLKRALTQQSLARTPLVQNRKSGSGPSTTSQSLSRGSPSSLSAARCLGSCCALLEDDATGCLPTSLRCILSVRQRANAQRTRSRYYRWLLFSLACLQLYAFAEVELSS